MAAAAKEEEKKAYNSTTNGIAVSMVMMYADNIVKIEKDGYQWRNMNAEMVTWTELEPEGLAKKPPQLNYGRPNSGVAETSVTTNYGFSMLNKSPLFRLLFVMEFCAILLAHLLMVCFFAKAPIQSHGVLRSKELLLAHP
ncbi:hypothetical protein KY284_007831 [Solanum tuberosum]|nr:hypothetical protein KY284_007831 [Solanum tuberosum]